MCGNCPDFVDMCTECYNPDGGRYNKYAKFYLGDTFCAHLAQTYGTSSASLYDHVYKEHDPYDYPDVPDGEVVFECDDHCIANGWYSRKEIERVSGKVYDRNGSEGL